MPFKPEPDKYVPQSKYKHLHNIHYEIDYSCSDLSTEEIMQHQKKIDDEIEREKERLRRGYRDYRAKVW